MPPLTIAVCANCGASVCPTSEGTCPACRQQFVKATPKQEAAFRAKKKALQATETMPHNANWYLEALRKYDMFNGRSRRKEYWTFGLVNMIIGAVLCYLEGLVGGPGLVASMFGLFVFLPNLAVHVRRLHDTDRSGWWLLIILVPILGPFLLIIVMLNDSTPGDNRYGPNPKYA